MPAWVLSDNRKKIWPHDCLPGITNAGKWTCPPRVTCSRGQGSWWTRLIGGGLSSFALSNEANAILAEIVAGLRQVAHHVRRPRGIGRVGPDELDLLEATRQVGDCGNPEGIVKNYDPLRAPLRGSTSQATGG